MVIGSAKDPTGKNWILIGLSAKNVEILKSGTDLVLRKETHPPMPDDVIVGIVYEETDALLGERLRHLGLIGPTTNVEGEEGREG